MQHSAADLSDMLAQRIEALCRELLPHGKREGAEWVAASLIGTSQRSLSVRLTGGKAGVWKDFTAEDVKGDAFDLAAFVLFNRDKKKAYRWALSWLGLSADAAPDRVPAAPVTRRPPAEDHDTGTRAAALRLYLASQPALRGTPADDYLKARGIDLAEMGRQPRALRFHPACRCIEAGCDMPAMIAAICDGAGRHIATHRTFLEQRGGVWMKATLQAPKKVLGSYAGGTIRLWRGASGKPLAECTQSETVVIGEGIETCLSVALCCPELRVLAAVALSNLVRIELPEAAIDLIILADNDTGNTPAEQTLQRAVNRLLEQGRSVRLARSSIGKDFNDALCAA